MKQKVRYLLTFLFLTIIGIGGAKADETSIGYTFTSKAWNAQIIGTVPAQYAKWSGTKEGNQFNSNASPAGVQVTTGVSGVVVTSPSEFSDVTKVEVVYSSSSKGVGSIEVKVGETSLGAKNISKSQSKTTLTYTTQSAVSGKVSFTVNCTTNSIGINSITIYKSSGETPAATFEYNSPSVDVTYGEEESVIWPSLTIPEGISEVIYESNNTDVATVDDDGKVTLVKPGEATISAVADDDSEASFTITYSKASPNLSYETKSYTVKPSATFATPELTNPLNVTGIVYSSSDTEVATINSSTGEVTIGSKEGTTTIHANFEANDYYNGSYATYTINVTSKDYSPAGKWIAISSLGDLVAGQKYIIGNLDAKALMGAQKDNNRTAVVVTSDAAGVINITNEEVKPFYLEGESEAWYFMTGDGYLYAASSDKNYLKSESTKDDNAKATISLENGEAKITFQGTFTRNMLRFNPNNGSPLFACYASNSTTGTLVKIYKEYVETAIKTPVISLASGTYFEPQSVTLSCETEGATIKYSTDGENWIVYSSAITIRETTTLYAKAVKGEDESAVASATYTFPTVYTTIAAFKVANTTGYINLTDAQVVYIDEAKKNIYVRDASAAICLYNRAGFTFEEGKELKAGDILSGTIYGKYALYNNNLPEITDIQNFDKLTVTDNTDVTPKAVASKEEIEANMCDLVKIAKTQITETDSKFYVLDVQLYDKLKLGYTPEIGVDASITGVVTDFNKTTEIFPRTLDDIAYYPAAPTFSPEAGTFTAAQDVTISTTTDGAEIYYTTDGSEPTTSSSKYSAAIPVNSSTTIKAIAVKNELSSSVAEATYTIEIPEPVVEPGTPAAIAAGFYTIKNLGNNQFVNVAGRKTVTFVGETATAPGTVIKVESNEKGQVQVLRSQGVDLPGYAERAMKYVPKVVQLVAEKLGAEGEGNLLGKDGLGKIMDKFNESFDYHLYTEQGEQGVRIYGKTPSMQPVVDFYNDNKANVDAKLPMLEDFINSAINKVLEKTGGSGASILTKFSLYEIWEKMGKTLTKPVDADSKLAFLQDVLSDKKYVWDFAYQTAMKYWKPLISHKMVQQKLSELGDLAQYVEKIEYIRPDVKYYIVQKEGKIDFISQDNTLLKEASSEWELTAREKFTVNFDEANYTLSGKDTKAYYTTAYTDFAYDLPEGVKAYTVSEVKKLEGVSDKYYAVTNAVEGTVPAQTPVLLVSSKTSADLDLNVNDGTAIENELKGNDWLVNKLEITTPQVDKLFGIVHDLLEYENMLSLYDRYVKEYEYLKKRNAGTVNNKYFFALSGDDIAEATMNIGQLAKDELGLAFSHNLEQSAANKAFLPSGNDPVYLSIIGDVNRDGKVNISDVTAQVNIILGKDKPEDNYDYDAADVDRNGEIRIGDVTELVNIILGKKSL